MVTLGKLLDKHEDYFYCEDCQCFVYHHSNYGDVPTCGNCGSINTRVLLEDDVEDEIEFFQEEYYDGEVDREEVLELDINIY